MARVENVQAYRSHERYIPVFEATLQTSFTNQPTNDQFEVVSASASDTQKITVWFTETGSTVMKWETLTLTGVAAVASTSTTVGIVYGAYLGDNTGAISKRAVGTITIRKKTGALAITTIAATKLASGTSYFYIGGKNIELENIAGNTWINANSPIQFSRDNASAVANLTLAPMANPLNSSLQLAGRMSKFLNVTDYISITSDTTGSTVQITVLA